MSTGDPLLASLVESPGRYGFFEIVRLLEHALGADVGAPGPDRGPDRILFEHSPALASPATDVESVRVDGEVARVATTFLGLLGTASPLTPEWSEEVLHGDDEGALRAFYDLFHHRALSLLASAWKEHALEGGFDLTGSDALSRRLRSLAGVDGWTDAEDDALPPMAAVGLADHQRGQPQAIDLGSAEALLRRIHPDWDLRLVGNLPRFEPYTQRERASLGGPRSRLGSTLVYGDGAVEAESLLRILIGPVGAGTYESLMPGGGGYAALESLTDRIFVGALRVEVEVEVEGGAAPTCTLGAGRGARLGVDARYAADPNAPVRVRVRLLQDAAAARREFLGGESGC